MKIIKKIIFPKLTILASLYISTLFALGILIGYLSTIFFFREFIDKGRIRSSINLSFGKWQVHFHHWLMAGFFLFLVWVTGSLHLFPNISLGFFGGLMLHDFHFDKDWYKIFKKML